MHLAASFDWETLLPVVFFVLYGIAQFLGSRKKGEAGENEADEPEVDPMERARQIREEIRRKIEERKQAYDPTVPEGWQDSQPRVMPPEPQPDTVLVKKAESVLAQKASMQRRLEEQRKRLEEARQIQRKAHQQALRIEQEAGSFHHKELGVRKRKRSETGSTSFQDQLLAGLRSQGGLRKAVLYREILDPPLGLR